MTMHLVGPYMTTTGKKKGKQKFRNAEAAKKARELAESWEKLKSKYEPKKPVAKGVTAYKEPKPYIRETPHYPSRDTGLGSAVKAEPKVYTGTLIKGIATMHKSNAVPIINDEQAIEISRMRR